MDENKGFAVGTKKCGLLCGAIGALVTNAVGEKALLLTLVPLAAVFLIMFIEEEREELEEEISGGRA